MLCRVRSHSHRTNAPRARAPFLPPPSAALNPSRTLHRLTQSSHIPDDLFERLARFPPHATSTPFAQSVKAVVDSRETQFPDEISRSRVPERTDDGPALRKEFDKLLVLVQELRKQSEESRAQGAAALEESRAQGAAALEKVRADGAAAKVEGAAALEKVRAEGAAALAAAFERSRKQVEEQRVDFLRFTLPTALPILQRAIDLTYLRKVELLSLGEAPDDFEERKTMTAAAALLLKDPSPKAQRAVFQAKRVLLTVPGAGVDASTDPELLFDLAVDRCCAWAPFHGKAAVGPAESYQRLLAWRDLPLEQRAILIRSQKEFASSSRSRNAVAHNTSLGHACFLMREWQLFLSYLPILPPGTLDSLPSFLNVETQLNFILGVRWQDLRTERAHCLITNPLTQHPTSPAPPT